jgi:hypothetical protein
MYKIHDQQQGRNSNRYTCGRCGGSGYISCYNHIMGGICFQCNGDGHLSYPTPDVSYNASNIDDFTKLMKRRWYFVVVVAGNDHYILDWFTYDGVNNTRYKSRCPAYVNEADSKLPSNSGIKLISGNCGEKKNDAINRLELKLVLPKAA